MTSARERTPGSTSGVGHQFIVADERRTADRISLCLPTKLTSLRGPDALTCEADNISEGGLHVRAPRAHGLAVGQRFEIRFLSAAEESTPAGLTSENPCATVVRTEPQIYPSTTDVGVGLRFDHPLFL